VQPDLTTLGKIVGGGLPVGAVVGARGRCSTGSRRLGKTYQAGTMAGNPWRWPPASPRLQELKKGAVHEHLAKLGAQLSERAAARGITMARVGSVFWPILDDGPVPHRAEDIRDSAVQAFKTRYRGWLDRGIYLPPSAYEVGFLSAAHRPEHIDSLVDALAT
jgi:glutamate-1-semialdehyde 2,1-aminomutase